VAFSGRSGLMSGMFTNPATHDFVPFLGAILQNQNIGGGLFFNSGKTGAVSLVPSK
ncbi:MAG: hypothetical protein QOD99_2953, partial [Chthoniobacter sp.]|nr:hypothetical protein [Chthoniobacter sp.]